MKKIATDIDLCGHSILNPSSIGGAYIKPSGGIPKSDLESSVQESIDSISGKYSKPTTGIPSSDLASSVQSSLVKADTALQSSDFSQENWVFTLEDGTTVTKKVVLKP